MAIQVSFEVEALIVERARERGLSASAYVERLVHGAERLDALLAEAEPDLPAESPEEVRAGLREALEDVKAGRTISLEQFEREFRATHGLSG